MGNAEDRITLGAVLKADVVPWLVSVTVVFLVYLGISTVIASVNPNLPRSDSDAILYSRAFVLFVVLLVVACFMARWSRDKWTWVLAVLTVLYFLVKTNSSIAMAAFPNSILPALLAMITLLAMGRIVEYIVVRLTYRSDSPVLDPLAAIVYFLLIIVTAGLNSTFVYSLLG